MRMMEANLFPVIPQPHVGCNNGEVTSMSDYVHDGRRSTVSAESATIESRLIFAACYVIFLFRALAIRLMPRRAQHSRRTFGHRESIFREASYAASVMVASSFMGL